MVSVRKSFSFGVTDEEMIYLFPYGKVKKNSSILIYGAGRVGQYYLQQINMTKYCHVLALVDKDWNEYEKEEINVEIVSPEKIRNFDFDYLVVALFDDSQRGEVYKTLCNDFGVYRQKIICESPVAKLNFFPKYSRYSGQDKNGFAYRNVDVLSIAFCAGGGMGDIIIEKKVINYLLEMTHEPFMVDVYGNENFLKSILSDCANINNYYPEGLYAYHRQKYDLAINCLYIMSVDVARYERILPNNRKLFGVVQHLEKQLEEYNLPASYNFELNSIHFGRCKYLKRNAFTAYSEPNGLEIYDSNVTIPLDNNYEDAYMKMKLKKYITIHYGWGEYNKTRKMHAKMWPAEYFLSLVKMIKKQYKGIEVIQLGEQMDLNIEGVDRYILGQDLELVKYILRDSILHIGGDGGLVHLATQLKTKCAVIFGPTPEWFFGYKSNINIVAKKCSACCFLERDFTKCLRRMEEPECMFSITPEIVMTNIQSYLNNVLR